MLTQQLNKPSGITKGVPIITIGSHRCVFVLSVCLGYDCDSTIEGVFEEKADAIQKGDGIVNNWVAEHIIKDDYFESDKPQYDITQHFVE